MDEHKQFDNQTDLEWMDKVNSATIAQKLAYGVLEAAHATGVGRSTLYEALASGELKAVKLGRRTLIPADELRRFLSTLPPARTTLNSV